MNNIEQLIKHFQRCSKFSFYGQSEKDGWRREGKGNVSVTQNANTLIITEQGNWNNQAQKKTFPFQGKWKWRFQNLQIDIFHLRQGIQHPTFLVSAVNACYNTWQSVLPHQCSLDLYSARIQLTNDAIEVSWKIIGPKKNEILYYRYS